MCGCILPEWECDLLKLKTHESKVLSPRFAAHERVLHPSLCKKRILIEILLYQGSRRLLVPNLKISC